MATRLPYFRSRLSQADLEATHLPSFPTNSTTFPVGMPRQKKTRRMRKRNAPFIRPTAVKRLEILLDSLLKELEDTLSQPISLLLQLVATWRLAKKQNPSFVVPTIAHMIPSVTQLALAALARAHVRRSQRKECNYRYRYQSSVLCCC